MKRRIGWRLYTLLTLQERELLEAKFIVGPEKKETTEAVRRLEARVRREHRVIFGKSGGALINYETYAGVTGLINSERLLWIFFPGTIDEHGGMLPTVTDVCWTANIVVLLVRVGAIRSLLVADDNTETEINVKRTARTIEEALNDGECMDLIGKVLKPVSDELATGLMMKR